MKRQKRKEAGITLIALVISIIVMLILAGVSINATVGDNGILKQAIEAKMAQELAQEREEIEYMMADFNMSGDNSRSALNAFLAKQVEAGKIDSFKSLPLNGKMQIVVQKGKNYYYCVQDGEYWIATETESSVDDIGKGSGFTVFSEENFKQSGSDGNFTLDKDSSIVFYDEIDGEFNFDIVSGEVTIYLTNNMTLTNEGKSRSAIDVHSGAILNLYIEKGKTVTVNSGFGEDAQGSIPGKGGYAGIHVPEGAELNLYGSGTITAIGGNGGSGSRNAVNGVGGAGGGGAGAGIGGNGGTGSEGHNGLGISGGNAENCGEIRINNDITVFAYGGGGGSGAPGNLKESSAGGGGGYPAAGIGGGGAGGAGGTCCAGAGGYSGGAANADERQFGINGLSGAGGNNDQNPPVYDCINGGGGYFCGGEGTSNGKNRYILALGGFHAQGWSIGDQSGDGGTAGKGGKIVTSENAKVYAFNGNLYSDGEEYEDGLNQCPIYIQNGIITAKYEYTKAGSNVFELNLKSAQTNADKTNYKNKKYEEDEKYKNNRHVNINKLLGIEGNSILNDIDMLNQGVGSGAGYIELDNGTYTVDSSLN